MAKVTSALASYYIYTPIPHQPHPQPNSAHRSTIFSTFSAKCEVLIQDAPVILGSLHRLLHGLETGQRILRRVPKEAVQHRVSALVLTCFPRETPYTV